MKKLILVLITIVVVGSNSVVFAEKPTNWVDLENIHASTFINHKVGDEYYPIALELQGTARTADNGTKQVASPLNIGTPSAEPFDLDTLAGQKAWYQALPAFLKPVAKDLRERATAEDISVE